MLECDNALLRAAAIQLKPRSKSSFLGLSIALCILGLWALSLVVLLSLNMEQLPAGLIAPLIFWQAFLCTGLFITAHDAMHGVIFPQDPKINNFIGSLSVFAYALFSYQVLLRKHWLHHRHPATELDPDFHDGQYKNPFCWYLTFMRNYFSWKQFLGLNLIFYFANFILHIPAANLICFWIAPLVLSSIQLFYFGTFLTHREPEEGYRHPHRARTNPLPVVWSFITFYHFGYHEEHHEYPHIPWWQLPHVRKARIRSLT